MDFWTNNSDDKPFNSGRILAAMFLLGVFSTLAQVIFLREMMVVFFGNELVIGTILAGWFVGISLGAYSARIVSPRFSSLPRIEVLLVAVLFMMAVLLPFQVYAVRFMRQILQVPAGEYASIRAILSSSFLVLLPTSFGIGVVFPFTSEMLSRTAEVEKKDVAGPVSRVYIWESLGSMAGGAVLTFLLLPFLSPLRIVLIAVCLGTVAAALLARSRRWPCRLPALVSLCLLLVVPLYPEVIDSFERLIIERQWRAFGALGDAKGGGGGPASYLRITRDSIYQNLAVIESEGQFTLYANGKVMFIFPDAIDYEHRVHFIMAQNPSAKRILLIGGNPAGEIPELLKYPLDRLVHVDLDPEVCALVGRLNPSEYDAVKKDRRVEFVVQDPPGFVQGCREKFDLVLINAPEPATVAANRFYTLEFYRNIRRILAQTGFIYTALNSSERLQSESVDLGASVYTTIRQVFPVVLVTAESQRRFIAGSSKSNLTFDRRTLFERSREAGISNKFFKPEYFLGADEIDPAKTRLVEEKFWSANISLNTCLRPVACFYNLMLWSRFSGSGAGQFLEKLKSIDAVKVVAVINACGLVMLIIVFLIRVGRGKPGGDETYVPGLKRLMAVILLASTGFCGISLEIILIFMFQGLFGYVYSMMGLIVAVFMLGLVIGGASGRLMARSGVFNFWFSLALVQVLLLVCSLRVPDLADVASAVSGSGGLKVLLEVLIYVFMGIIGWAVGAEFPLVNRLYSEAGGTVRSSAAITDAADHSGAAIGALITGVVLVPVLGLESSCSIIAAVNFIGLACLVVAFVSRRLE